MGVSIIVGGQFGSEGKGKVARWFAEKHQVSSVVRVGGINSGHTVIDAMGRAMIFRILPTAAIDRQVTCILPAGSYLTAELLFQEIRQAGISLSQIKIHPHAVIITEREVELEQKLGLTVRLGSTGSGTGAAVGLRAMRDPKLTLAKDLGELKDFLCDTNEFLRKELTRGHRVLIEGTQGFGLSCLHSPYYPKATSRDTTAAGFLSEVGLSPFDVEHIMMVIRSYPIRVCGDSGPLPHETTWENVTAAAGRKNLIQEYTSVTKHLRRVGQFDPAIVLRAIAANRPDQLVLNHLDYFPGEPGILGPERMAFIDKVQDQLGQKLDYVGLDPITVNPV